MRRAVKLSLGVVGVLAAAAAVCAVRPSGPPEPKGRMAEAATPYHCPMHPSYVSDKPGECPICGMRLVPHDHEGRAPSGEPSPDAGPEAGRTPADRVSVTLPAGKRRTLGLRSEPVVRGELAPVLRTVGRVTVDERRVHHIHTKFEGYIETLHVDFTGKFVRRGQPLASIFSPELVASQEEYLLARRAQESLGRSAVASVAMGGAGLLEAARRRLLLFDVSKETIDHLERTGEVKRSLDIHSPVSGYVVAKTALHGMRVMPADTLFDVADLSNLWVMADVYEQDLAAVRLGTPAEIAVSSRPGRTWTSQVAWIAPTLDAATRTVKVRLEIDDAQGELKPEMFADVTFHPPSGRALLVPEGAVIRSGDRDLVFVDDGAETLTPREITLGRKAAGAFEVKAGLEEGERVVAAANFLLDSESSLKAALHALSRNRPPVSGAAPEGSRKAPAPGHVH